MCNEDMGVCSPRPGAAFEADRVDDFRRARSSGAQAALLQAHCRAGGPVAGGLQAFRGRGAVQIRKRRRCQSVVSGKSGDEVDVTSV